MLMNPKMALAPDRIQDLNEIPKQKIRKTKIRNPTKERGRKWRKGNCKTSILYGCGAATKKEKITAQEQNSTRRGKLSSSNVATAYVRREAKQSDEEQSTKQK